MNFNIFWGFQKNEYFLVMVREIVDIFGGSSQNWIIFGGYLCSILGFFLRSRYIIGIFLGGCYVSNIFLGMPDMPDIFFL